MKISKGKRRSPIVPINSMSDIAFLLLIFIMLISLLNYRKEIKISYAEAEFSEVTQADNNLEIWFDIYGQVFYDGTLITLQTAENIIADSIAKDPTTRIHILADRDTPYKHINEIIEILKLLQHRAVSFIVKDMK